MALQIWLPLTKDLVNYGMRQDITFSIINNNNKLVYNTSGKLGGCYERTTINTADCIRSNKTIFLDNDFSMCCWALISQPANTSSAQGLITNHSHSAQAGGGITMRYISSTDYRISCNTGTGSSRTYCTYAGSTNIYNAWHHLGLTYHKETKKLRLYVDGQLETISSYNSNNVATVIGKELTYNMAATDTYFDLFNWSTTYVQEGAYRPKCKLNDVRVYDHCLSPREMQTISQGLLLNYKLHNFVSDIATEYDCSGFGVNGVRHGTLASSTSTANYDSALLFADGRNDYITSATTVAPKDAITLSCWIKGTEAGYSSYHIPLCFNSSQYEISINPSGKLRGGFVITDATGASVRKCTDATHSNSILDGEWHMLTLTYDGRAIMRYVDGVEARVADEANYKLCPGTLSGASGQWYIGNYSKSGSYGNKNLTMSDVRVYARALTAVEIKQLYNTSISLTRNGVLLGHELVEQDNATSVFSKAGIIKTHLIKNCDNDGVLAEKLQVFNDCIQSTDFIEW